MDPKKQANKEGTALIMQYFHTIAMSCAILQTCYVVLVM